MTRDEDLIEAARQTFRGVFERSGSCTAGLCRRRRACLAGWDVADRTTNWLHHETGGCPVMRPEEWRVIQYGIAAQRRVMGAWMAARRDAEPEAPRRAPAEAGPAGPAPCGFGATMTREEEADARRRGYDPSFAEFVFTDFGEVMTHPRGLAWPRDRSGRTLRPRIRLER